MYICNMILSISKLLFFFFLALFQVLALSIAAFSVLYPRAVQSKQLHRLGCCASLFPSNFFLSTFLLVSRIALANHTPNIAFLPGLRSIFFFQTTITL